MSASRPARFTQRDVTRALKGAAAAGVKAAVELLPDGTMRVLPLDPAAPPLRSLDAMIEAGKW